MERTHSSTMTIYDKDNSTQAQKENNNNTSVKFKD